MTDAFALLFQQMLQQGQDMARAFNPALISSEVEFGSQFTSNANR